ncbi:hypothetical protein [Oscillatoria sp. HE19RPO]|uniref:hypothetical protein n=1 Tax=Oscillatoria sp. HE19RPO TaxID=2954806 RepID=UPI0020C59A18|nr:hypothetical protein [Oscillatoria sp. HE19RPO]
MLSAGLRVREDLFIWFQPALLTDVMVSGIIRGDRNLGPSGAIALTAYQIWIP